MLSRLLSTVVLLIMPVLLSVEVFVDVESRLPGGFAYGVTLFTFIILIILELIICDALLYWANWILEG